MDPSGRTGQSSKLYVRFGFNGIVFQLDRNDSIPGIGFEDPGGPEVSSPEDGLRLDSGTCGAIVGPSRSWTGAAEMSAATESEDDQRVVRLVWDVSLRLTTIWGLGVAALVVAGWRTSRADLDSLRSQINSLESRIHPIQQNQQNVTVEQGEGLLEKETRRILARGKHGDL